MPTPLNIGTRNIPLKFAENYSKEVNSKFENYQFSEATEITNELLKYWFSDAFCELRDINFHQGQKQAILNTIYAHEILKTSSVMDLYINSGKDLLQDSGFLSEVSKPKNNYPKYCMKMATGTGKTWVMHAIVIWQYLNAKWETHSSGRFSKNFLLVAPGLIVYERLLDAYLGKLQTDNTRNFDRSDFKQFEELFLPRHFRDEIFGFIQSSTAGKEEIGRKVTGDGLLAITNWHLLQNEEEDDTGVSPLDNVTKNINELLPITPGTSAGHSLENLDNNYLKGGELDYLKNLPDLVVINDEAHHIHENKSYGEIKEVEWQRSLNYISEGKKKQFIQIDFSATPYDVSGSGQKRTKHYFPHIIIDFDLKTAIHAGLVKTIALDKRKEIATLELDFKAERDERNKVIGLSEGQRVMLRAGLSRLKILENEFVKLTADKDGISNKHPKMFIICEDTSVTPFVTEFMISEGLPEEDVMQIDSNRKGEIPQSEWQAVKQKLFDIDNNPSPKVIISVLMLREGFDVNNICVIVPLRTADALILLEQTIGRGLRLMWREPEYREIKEENRRKLLIEKQEPDNFMDILHIVEHPNFVKFYDELIKEGAAGTTTGAGGGGVLGDIIKVGLKENFEKYDLYWLTILRDKEEELAELDINIDTMKTLKSHTLEQLLSITLKGGEKFYSEEMTVKTRFGEYSVKGDIFTAQSYNEFLSKMINLVNSAIVSVGIRRKSSFPFMQVNTANLVRVMDIFIRTKLFGQIFDPFLNENWRVLLVAQGIIIDHLAKEMSEAIYKAQQNINFSEAVVVKNYFSSVPELKMRERFCIAPEKTIYKLQSYPSNKGTLEKEFMEYIDSDSDTMKFIKINEHYHDFAKILYIRTDGLLSNYSPDFLVETKKGIYIVETKAESSISEGNVLQKRRATLDWVNRVNQLLPEIRMNKVWSYVLLSSDTFYLMKNNGANPSEMFEYCKITKEIESGTLFG